MITVIFVIASILIFNGVALLIPKKLTKIEIYNSSIFVLLIQLLADVILAVKYNLYGYLKEGVDLIAFLIFFAIYPAFNIIMLNYFPFHKKFTSKILYVIGVSILCLFYEWISVKAKFFYYDEWKLLYAAFCYPILIVILALNLTILRKLMIKSQ